MSRSTNGDQQQRVVRGGEIIERDRDPAFAGCAARMLDLLVGCGHGRPTRLREGPMSRVQCLLWSLSALAQMMLSPAPASAEEPTAAAASAEAEVRQAIREYDAALRRADVAALEKIWASEFTFVNARGERLTRAERLTNVRTGQTGLTSLAHVPEEERIQVYGDIALYTTLLTLSGRYGGETEQGQFRALVVWVRRDGRWQQLANQMTPVVAP
jgi:ketosteroid isomerase-like protein